MDKIFLEMLADSAQELHQQKKEIATKSDTGFLTVKVDIDCKIFCDGDFLDLVEANKVKKIPIEIGQHLITIESENMEGVSEDREIHIKETGKNYLLIVKEMRIKEEEVKNAGNSPMKECGDLKCVESINVKEDLGSIQVASRIIFDKKCCINCLVDKNGEWRTNPDGTKFYPTKCVIAVGDNRYIIPDLMFMNDGFVIGPMAPAISIDSSNGNITAFVMQKDSNSRAYSMEGYIYTIDSENNISKVLLFSKVNYGWFPNFIIIDGKVSLNIFSFSYYKPMRAIFYDNNWLIQNRDEFGGKTDKILDSIVDEQKQNGLIHIR